MRRDQEVRLRLRRLRLEAGILVAVFMAVGSAVAGAIASREMSTLAHQAALREGRAALDALAIPAAVAIATHDYTKLDNFVAELARAQRGELISMMVVDADGKMIATSKTGLVGMRTHELDETFISRALLAHDVWFAFGPDPYAPKWLDIAKPIEQGQRWGTLIARFSMASTERAFASLERKILIVTVVAALVGWAIAFFLLSQLVIGPMRELAGVATKLGNGELSVRSTLQRADEIGQLSDALNVMADRLKVYTSSLEDAVQARTKELREANEELARLATTDGLTGLKNHRYFRNTLEFELKRGARRPHQLTLCMIDIDLFKKFNDTWGHPAGDDVLREVGRILTSSLRATDVIARYGGEEFAAILLDTGPDEGFRTAQKIVQLFREAKFEGEEALPTGKLTVSVGFASYPDDADSPNQLIRAADLALYEAKRRGRNGVVRYSVDIPQHTGMTSDVAATMPLLPEPKK
jgi:diguanylate cyclase (GGDEF)-like protein